MRVRVLFIVTTSIRGAESEIDNVGAAAHSGEYRLLSQQVFAESEIYIVGVAARCRAPSAAPPRRQRIATYRILAKPNFAADTGQAFQPRQERRQGERREEEGKERR